MSPPPPIGSLADVSFPELLKRLHDDGFTGQLALVREGERKSVEFQAGRVTFARSSNPEDRLGEFLLRRGTIQLQHYLASASRIVPGKRQGAVLCELGAISPDELVRVVTEQVSEILYTLFRWTSGTYEVRPDPGDSPERIVLTISTEDVILQGMRRVDDWGRIWRGLGAAIETRFSATQAAGGIAYRAALTDDEGHVLSLVNGSLDVGRILAASYVSSYQTCRILWALRVLGAIAPVGADDRPSHPSEDYALADLVEDYDRTYTHVYHFVAERIGDLVDHFMDRALDQAQGRSPQALADINLRNQGRVEYEQLLANLGGADPGERRRVAHGALGSLLELLVRLTGRELGPDEQATLVEQLRELVPALPQVPLTAILDRTAQPPLPPG